MSDFDPASTAQRPQRISLFNIRPANPGSRPSSRLCRMAGMRVPRGQQISARQVRQMMDDHNEQYEKRGTAGMLLGAFGYNSSRARRTIPASLQPATTIVPEPTADTGGAAPTEPHGNAGGSGGGSGGGDAADDGGGPGGGTQKGDSDKGGSQAGGNQKAKSEAGGSQAGGSQAGGSQAGGSKRGPSQEGGSQRGGSQGGQAMMSGALQSGGDGEAAEPAVATPAPVAVPAVNDTPAAPEAPPIAAAAANDADHDGWGNVEAAQQDLINLD